MIEINQLIQLVTINEKGTISAASEALHISQPALSRSMQRLENELGVEIFDHYKNKVVLNEAGTIAVNYALKVIEDANTLKDEVYKFNQRLSHIIIAAPTPAPVWDITPMIKKLYSFEVDCHVMNNCELLKPLRNKECDMIISLDEINEDDIICIPYLEETLMLSVPLNHHLANQKLVKYDDLKGETMLMYENNGFWGEHHLKYFPETTFIVQKDRNAFKQIVRASTFPSFTTNLSIKREGEIENRVSIPFDEEHAQVDFYLCILKKDKNKYKKLLKEVENYFEY